MATLIINAVAERYIYKDTYKQSGYITELNKLYKSSCQVYLNHYNLYTFHLSIQWDRQRFADLQPINITSYVIVIPLEGSFRHYRVLSQCLDDVLCGKDTPVRLVEDLLFQPVHVPIFF